MIHTAWQNYVKFAWGLNTLFPVQGIGSNEQPGLGGEPLALSLVEALDTLYIANMTEEFNRGRAWVAQNLTFSNLVSEAAMQHLTPLHAAVVIHTFPCYVCVCGGGGGGGGAVLTYVALVGWEVLFITCDMLFAFYCFSLSLYSLDPGRPAPLQPFSCLSACLAPY